MLSREIVLPTNKLYIYLRLRLIHRKKNHIYYLGHLKESNQSQTKLNLYAKKEETCINNITKLHKFNYKHTVDYSVN